MKNRFVVLMALCASVLVACGDKKEEAHKAEAASQPSVLSVIAEGTASASMPDLARKYNCTACHAIDKKVVGPSYKDVAAKYAGADAAKVDELAAKVIKGGVGVWGPVPMPPNAKVTPEDAKTLVQWVLTQK